MVTADELMASFAERTGIDRLCGSRCSEHERTICVTDWFCSEIRVMPR